MEILGDKKQTRRPDAEEHPIKAWERWDGAAASHQCGAPTPLRKPYEYINTYF
jgi:hypothetical protein